MKIFIHGLPDSGSSLLAFLLAQRENSVAVLDCYGLPASALQHTSDVILKTTTNEIYSVEQEKAAFGPDYSILIQRNPFVNYQQLSKKSYKDERGQIQEKFRIFEDTYKKRRELFDSQIYYEELLMFPQKVIAALQSIGFQLSYYAMKRPPKEIEDFAKKSWPWAKKHWMKSWAPGDLDSGKVSCKSLFHKIQQETRDKVIELCPVAAAEYPYQYS